MRCRMFNSIPGSVPIPVAPLLSCDDLKCLQILPSIPGVEGEVGVKGRITSG